MNAACSLPLCPADGPLTLPEANRDSSAPLPRVERIMRRGPLLHAGPLPGRPDVLSLNLAQGCAHRCAVCSVRAYPSYRGDDVIYLAADAPARLAAELKARRQRPRAVYLSPATDPFMPLAEVQQETGRLVEVLAAHGVEAWLMTRGYIRPGVFDVLTRHRPWVKVTVGITTLNRARQRRLEPLAAPPRLRLRQIARLRAEGIAVGVQVAPLVPGITDERDNLVDLLAGLASVGVTHVSAGYMFVRAGIETNLARALPGNAGPAVLGEFANGPVLAAGGIMAARYLPRRRRQHGYAALMTLAAEHGIRVSVCGLTNPDFGPPAVPAKPGHPLLPGAFGPPGRRRSPLAG